MPPDRSPMWIGLADLLLCILSVVIVAVAPTKAKVDGVKPNAEFLITADWKVELDSDVDLGVVGPEKKPVFYGSREGRMRFARSRQSWLFDVRNHARRRLARASRVEQGNDHDPLYRT